MNNTVWQASLIFGTNWKALRDARGVSLPALCGLATLCSHAMGSGPLHHSGRLACPDSISLAVLMSLWGSPASNVVSISNRIFSVLSTNLVSLGFLSVLAESLHLFGSLQTHSFYLSSFRTSKLIIPEMKDLYKGKKLCWLQAVLAWRMKKCFPWGGKNVGRINKLPHCTYPIVLKCILD